MERAWEMGPRKRLSGSPLELPLKPLPRRLYTDLYQATVLFLQKSDSRLLLFDEVISLLLFALDRFYKLRIAVENRLGGLKEGFAALDEVGEASKYCGDFPVGA